MPLFVPIIHFHVEVIPFLRCLLTNEILAVTKFNFFTNLYETILDLEWSLTSERELTVNNFKDSFESYFDSLNNLRLVAAGNAAMVKEA